MNELIKIIVDNGRQAVSARELYIFLGIYPQFPTWIGRMFEKGFIEGLDYWGMVKVEEPNNHVKVDYALTVDCAKRISELQGTVKGNEATEYFESVEKGEKVLFADSYGVSGRSCLIGEMAKILNQNGIRITGLNLLQWLKSYKYLHSKGELVNRPVQGPLDIGLFEVKKSIKVIHNGSVTITYTTMVTPKGQIYFVNKFLSQER